MKYISYTWDHFNNDIIRLEQQIIDSKFKPELVMGITRGGACLATALSYKMNIPVVYINPKEIEDDFIIYETRILIVDDINDSGKTIQMIRNNLSEYIVMRNNAIEEDDIKFLTLYNNVTSISKVNYSLYQMDKSKDEDKDTWIRFPWEFDNKK